VPQGSHPLLLVISLLMDSTIGRSIAHHLILQVSSFVGAFRIHIHPLLLVISLLMDSTIGRSIAHYLTLHIFGYTIVYALV
jgi:predicted nucleic acid-binding protein